MIDEAVLFGRFGSLVGVVSGPLADRRGAGNPAVILLNAGLLHHVGPNRLYVRLARALARRGFHVLRFDFSGTGDSLPRTDTLPVEQAVVEELEQAMAFLSERVAATRFLLIGHCSGAYLALHLAARDPRVAGAVLMNPDAATADWVDYDRRRKEVRGKLNTYLAAMTNIAKWRHLLSGRASIRRIGSNLLRGIVANVAALVMFRVRRRVASATIETQPSTEMGITREKARAVAARGARMLFMHSEGSTNLDYLRSILGDEIEHLRAAGALTVEIIPQSDHLFSPLAAQARVLEIIESWASLGSANPTERPLVQQA